MSVQALFDVVVKTERYSRSGDRVVDLYLQTPGPSRPEDDVRGGQMSVTFVNQALAGHFEVGDAFMVTFEHRGREQDVDTGVDTP